MVSAGRADGSKRHDEDRNVTLTTPSTGTIWTHDKGMAADFLTALNSAATKFTFQFFNDGDDRYAEVVHGSLDEGWLA